MPSSSNRSKARRKTCACEASMPGAFSSSLVEKNTFRSANRMPNCFCQSLSVAVVIALYPPRLGPHKTVTLGLIHSGDLLEPFDLFLNWYQQHLAVVFQNVDHFIVTACIQNGHAIG